MLCLVLSMKSRWLLPLALLALSSCKDPAETRAGGQSSPPAQIAQAEQAQQAPTKPKSGSLDWDTTIAWKSWDEGLKLAQSTNKPVMLLVYAEWCPHCRELKPVFADPDIIKLSEQLVMVRQDADEDPPWLRPKLGHLGSYVPRLFFLKPDGTVQADITSGNGRFPYFYTREGIEALKSSMKRALSS